MSPPTQKPSSRNKLFSMWFSWRLFLPILNVAAVAAAGASAPAPGSATSRLAFLVQKSLLFFGESWAVGDVFVAVKIDSAVDDGFLDHGENAERIVIVNRQIRVFAHFNRAHALVNSKLDGRIDGHHLQRVIMGHS